VVDLDEAPGHGELLSMRAAGICASDLMYLRIGTDRVVGPAAHVTADREGLPSERLHLAGDRFTRIGFAAGDHHVGASGREAEDDRTPQPAAPPR
jgi:hypothetical protein